MCLQRRERGGHSVPPPGTLILEKTLDVGKRDGVAERREGAVTGNLARRPKKPAPGRARQRATDADTSHAKGSQLFDGGERRSNKHVDRRWCDAADDGRDLLVGADAGSVDAIGPSLCERREST